MPSLTPFTEGPLTALKVGAAGEQAAIIACLYAGDEERFAAIVGPFDGEATTRLLWFVMPTNATVRAAVWTQPGHLYLAFGGTHAWHQWPRHFTGALSAPYRDHEGDAVEGIGVNGFHQAVARTMWDIVFSAFPEDWLSREVRVAGHSLGGSVAQLVGWRLAQLGHGARVQTITVGAPRVILGYYQGPRPYAEYRVTHDDDMVTHSPPPYTSSVIEGVQGILLIRSPRPKGDRALADNTTGGLFKQWLHYGDSYSTNTGGGITYRRWYDSPRLADPWHQVSLKTASNHLILSYLRRLEASLLLYGSTVDQRNAVTLGIQAQSSPLNPMPQIEASPLTGADLPWSNAQLIPAPSTPLTASNGATIQGVLFSSPRTGLDPSTLKDALVEDLAVGMYELTVFTNNDRNGTSNTITLDGANESDARAMVGEFAKRRARLLGADHSDTVYPFFAEALGPGAPAVEFGRYRDAVNPRVGDVFPIRGSEGSAYPATNTAGARLANAADPLWVSVNCTLTAGTGTFQRKYILKITGVPDKVVSRAAYDGGQLVGNSGLTFDRHYRNLISWLTSVTSGKSFGVTARNPAAEKVIAGWAPDATTGEAKATINAHGYADGDYIRISRTGWWYLNRTWLVEVVDVNTIRLKRSQMTTAQVPPNKGRALRVVTAQGVRVVEFLRFNAPSWLDVDGPGAAPVRITKKRPGPRFDPVSFSPTRKAIKK